LLRAGSHRPESKPDGLTSAIAVNETPPGESFAEVIVRGIRSRKTPIERDVLNAKRADPVSRQQQRVGIEDKAVREHGSSGPGFGESQLEGFLASHLVFEIQYAVVRQAIL